MLIAAEEEEAVRTHTAQQEVATARPKQTTSGVVSDGGGAAVDVDRTKLIRSNHKKSVSKFVGLVHTNGAITMKIF